MICPKCGFEQPDSPECMRCGVIVSRYKGPVLGASAPRPPAPSFDPVPAGPPPGAFGAPQPLPAMAAGAASDPMPALPAGGGTVYNG
ncbi:MAG TPA: hypothetical protein VLR69_19600, partial [Thermoanaerobaculia bacterium]|nr:hypothetical protein [Thermoanaerobaculia bacterium]